MTKQKQILTLLLLCAWSGTRIAQAASAPQIRPPSLLEHKAVFSGGSNSFAVTATGDAPLSFQWRLDGQDLAAQTNSTITITNAQAADEGDYTVLVKNPLGEATSRPARLFVVPAAELPLHNFTNELGQRLPYLYVVPQNYNPSLNYSLFVGMAGAGLNENNIRNNSNPGSEFTTSAANMALTSYRESVRHPAIILIPLRRSNDQVWSTGDLPLVVGIINHLVTNYSISTNQIHLWGFSDGGGASVALLEKYPNLFASAFLVAGTGATSKPSLFKHVPLWVFHARDDANVPVSSSRTLVSALRRAGGNPIYSEFTSGGHVGPLGPVPVSLLTPLLLDWLVAQKVGTLPQEPFLLINSPTHDALYTTGAASLSLAGSVEAVGEGITGISWENTTSNVKGLAAGTTNWNTTEIPLLADKTNTLLVTATTTINWAPSNGGTTTLSATFSVISRPIRASLALEPPGAILNWTGGVAPFRVQKTSGLPPTNWIDMGTDAVPPLTLSLDQAAGFYRVIGQ